MHYPLVLIIYLLLITYLFIQQTFVEISQNTAMPLRISIYGWRAACSTNNVYSLYVILSAIIEIHHRYNGTINKDC